MITGNSVSDITEFYENRTIFLTGSTGFVGKTLLEKLLRACPGLKRIYILIRSKHGVDIQTRLGKLFDSPLFTKLRSTSPDLLSKAVPIEGELSAPQLGISHHDRQLLYDEVSVVVHAAATVKFNESLKSALGLNVTGTQRMIELCKGMKNLVSFVHLSTAYAHCDRDMIDEVIYSLSEDPNTIFDSLNEMSDSDAESITGVLIGNRPNTYTYTKALTECLLNQSSHLLPICIVRPSIVTASWKEPFPGWVDGLHGATGAIAAIGVGALQSLRCQGEKVGDFLPVDLLVNLVLGAARERASSPPSPSGPSLYNCCSGTQNPVLWGEVEGYLRKGWTKFPFSGAIREARISFHSSWLRCKMADLIHHFIPACLLDIKTLLLGRKGKSLKGSLRMAKAMGTTEFFRTREWNFVTGNMMCLRERLSAEDKLLYNFDIKELNWAEYFENYCLGVSDNILKRKDSRK